MQLPTSHRVTFAPDEPPSVTEQRQIDRERVICDRDARTAQVAYKYCGEWSDLDKVRLACRLLLECVDARDGRMPEGTLPRRLFDVYDTLDEIYRRMEDQEANDATD